MVASLPARESLWQWIEGHPGQSRHPVEASVADQQASSAGSLGQLSPAPLPLGAAHLEDVGEVGVEVQPQIDVKMVATEARDPQPLVADPVPEKGAAKEVQLAARQPKRAARLLEVGVRQIDSEEIVLLLHGRAEQQRAAPTDPQLQAGEKPGVVEVDALLAEPHRQHVTMAIEDGEHPAMLEHARPVIGSRRRRLDIELVVVTQHLVVGMLWMADLGHVTPQASSTPEPRSTDVESSGSSVSAGTRPRRRWGWPRSPAANNRS